MCLNGDWLRGGLSLWTGRKRAQAGSGDTCGASKWGTSLPGAMTFNLVTKDYCSPGDRKAELPSN